MTNNKDESALPMDKNVYATIAALEHDWSEAWLARNAVICDYLVGDDYLEIDPEGHIVSKGEWIDALESSAPREIRWGEIRVRPFGRFAIVHGRIELANGADDGARRRGYIVTDVWAFRGLEWRVVSRQLTSIKGAVKGV